MNLTKTAVEKLLLPVPVPPAKKAQTFYRDERLKGFAVRVTSAGVKTFIVEKRINGRVKRIKLGRFGELTVEQARKQAQKLLGEIAAGIDPVAKKKEARAKTVTLGECFDRYLEVRHLKETTLKDYRYIMKRDFGDWQKTQMLNISKDMVARRHSKLGKSSHSRANNAMRVLRAVFNFAAGEYEDAQGRSLFLENPTRRLSHTRAWFRIGRKQTYIKQHELPAWYEAVMALDNDRVTGKAEVVRDYLLLILFTGLRRTEAATLKWNQVDLVGRTLIIHDTKNHEQHTLPLSDYLYDLLSRRKAVSESVYVFDGDGKAGYLNDPRKCMLRVIEASGVEFALHDLRRTFITIAESLDIPAYALKRLLNHKMNNDVTAGYIIIDVERLRQPMQQVTDYILSVAGVREMSNVVAFRKL